MTKQIVYDALDEVNIAIERQYTGLKRATAMGSADRIKEIRAALATLDKEHAAILNCLRAEKHELIIWNERRKAASAAETMRFAASLDRWSFCAEQFVKAHIDSPEAIEWYNEMLANVALGTDYPCLTSQSEPNQTSKESEPTGPLTFSRIWYASRDWVALALFILFFAVAITLAHT